MVEPISIKPETKHETEQSDVIYGGRIKTLLINRLTRAIGHVPYKVTLTLFAVCLAASVLPFILPFAKPWDLFCRSGALWVIFGVYLQVRDVNVAEKESQEAFKKYTQRYMVNVKGPLGNTIRMDMKENRSIRKHIDFWNPPGNYEYTDRTLRFVLILIMVVGGTIIWAYGDLFPKLVRWPGLCCL